MPKVKKTNPNKTEKTKREAAPGKTVLIKSESKVLNNSGSTTDKKEVKKNKPTANIYDLEGMTVGKITLPEEIFASSINKTLIAQAVRVYLANQRLGTASTKTRGEVKGSTRKIYRQKGTGRARHGSVSAPIFVHGGVVFGPKQRDYSLNIPQKMKRRALFSALTAKLESGQIKILQGIEKLEPKTKNFVKTINKLGLDNKKKILIITPYKIENLKRAASNVEGISITAANRLNAYDILNNRQLLFIREAVEELKKTFLKAKGKKSKNN